MNEDQEKLIKFHLDPSNFLNEGVIAEVAFLFSCFEDDFVKKVNKETFYLLPYKDISIYVYESDLDSIPSNTINGFATTVKDFFIKNNMCTDVEHMVKCYEKFIDHILLAFAQKQFMLRVSLSAFNTAKNADSLAVQAGALATKAEKLAAEADAQAKSTIANYISILGIFASIIFTLFGGVNLIGATVKLLETGSRWPYLTFIISLLMICLLTLLNMMVKWINSMSNLKRALEKEEVNNGGKLPFKLLNPCTWDFYTKAVFCFLVVLLISMCGMYHVKKEEFKSHTKEITSQMESSEREEKSSKDTDAQSNKPSMTIVEKTTVANHLPSSKDDKDD